MMWRTIETAPRDGATVLLYSPDGDGEDAERTVAAGSWGERGRGDYCWLMEAGDGWTDPTHWMPLHPGPGETPGPLLAKMAEALKAAQPIVTDARRASADLCAALGMSPGDTIMGVEMERCDKVLEEIREALAEYETMKESAGG